MTGPSGKSVSLSSGGDKAVIGTFGAHVKELYIRDRPVIKPSQDGSQTHGGIAVLLPYADRVRGGRYNFGGRRYRLPVGKDGNAIHGYAKDMMWSLEERRQNSVELTCTMSGEGYPSTLQVKVRYTVGGSRFVTECSTKNVGMTACPVVVGFHPYFLAEAWKISTGPRTYRYKLADRYFPTGDRERFSFVEVGPDSAIDDSFRVDGPVRLWTEAHTLVIRRQSMPYLQVYNGKYAEGKSVAVEPYSGLTDAYNNGIGLRTLQPDGTFSCGYEVTLEMP